MTELRWLEDASLFASGSHALVELVCWGARQAGWRRLWLPSYYCPDVPAAVAAAVGGEVELRAYPDAALWSSADLGSIPAAAGDAVVVANQIGVRRRPEVAPAVARGAVVVEDHSHDLASSWALESTADYAFASLRKTLPIPDGGAVWSPQGHDRPPEPASRGDGGEPLDRAGRTADRLAASLDARGRLAAPPDDRLRFRALARVAARSAGAAEWGGISPVSRALLRQMPMRAWRERRRRNLALLADASASASGLRILAAPPGGVAFALTLVFDSAEARQAAERALTARAVAPTVMWPLDPARDWGVGPADADLAGRILSIHGDQRYAGGRRAPPGEDPGRGAARLRTAGQGAGARSGRGSGCRRWSAYASAGSQPGQYPPIITWPSATLKPLRASSRSDELSRVLPDQVPGRRRSPGTGCARARRGAARGTPRGRRRRGCGGRSPAPRGRRASGTRSTRSWRCPAPGTAPPARRP